MSVSKILRTLGDNRAAGVAEGSVNWFSYFGKLSWHLLKPNILQSCDTAILFSHIFPRKMSICIYQKALVTKRLRGLPKGSEVKVSAWNAGDPVLIPGLRRSSGEGNDNPLQYSCLENPMDGGMWWATVHGVAKSLTQLSNFTLYTFSIGY